ncbi:hypothetical protein C943_03540 [Mariniradius saccharolyticus AK6]|uniref:Uncharacterized protein n=1 Tax=Mariniradius saccharolyticus AK6 TaxID=1239962 RepID=M7YAX1_9BACT|nr:hypothetical protein [Mariniradius saccharolyticus]EMS34321.1 hypothetical protein C943_03540 [Mariniradius saccharolyticus AK6]
MAKVIGIPLFVGTVGNLTIYKTKDGMLARQKGGPSRQQVKHSKQFENSRRASAEFGEASRYAGKLRRAVWPILYPMRSQSLNGRLTAKFRQVLLADPVHGKGERKVLSGNLGLLRDFEFGDDYHVTGQLRGLPKVSAGDVVLLDFAGLGTVKRVAGAQYVQVVAGLVALQEKTDSWPEWHFSQPLPLDSPLSELDLREIPIPPVPAETPLLLVLGTRYFQSLAQGSYPLTEGVAVRVVAILDERI